MLKVEDDDTPKSGSSQPGVIQLNDSKAGMQGLDLDKINKIINDTSKGSKFYEHKKKSQEQLKKRVADMKVQVASLSPETIAKAEKQVDLLAKELEEKRELSRTIVHLDMDAFYASVEMRDNPALKNVPMAVGGSSMLSTSNYHARKYGIRSGMPGFIARKLCPQLIIVPLNFPKYTAASKEVEQVLAPYDTETLSVSMDEAVLDITQHLAERNSSPDISEELTAPELVEEIRAKIFSTTGLTASAGIAANGLLAKICSDINKPNNQYYLECSKEAIQSFLNELQIRKVCGIGPVTEQMLNGLEIKNCGDLWQKRGLIQLIFKPATASFLLAASLGIGGSFMSASSFGDTTQGDDASRKSISCERTFGKASKDELKQMCHDLSLELEKELEKKGATGKTITLKIKTIHFDVKTRARSIAEYTSSAGRIFNTAWSIYSSYENEIPDLQLRLMGIRISNLRFDDDDEDAGMKQQTLSQLFSKAAKNKPQTPHYFCPCCQQQFASVRELSAHVDTCLILLNSEEGDENKLTNNDNSEEINDFQDNPVPSTSTGFYGGVNGGEFNATCPICNQSLKFRSKEEVDVKMNTHIDECLNVSVVKGIMEENYNDDDIQEVPCTSSSINPPSTGTKRPLEEHEPSNPAPTKQRSMEIIPSTQPRINNNNNKPSSKSKSKQSYTTTRIDSFFKRDS